MKKNKAFIAYLIATVTSNVWSGSMGNYNSPDSTCSNKTSSVLQKVLTLSIGPAWSNNGETQTLYLQPDIEKTYSANFHSNILPYGAVFLGIQHRLNRVFFHQIGLEVAGGGKAELKGSIWEDADPNFNNYKYTYNINELRVMAKTKLLMDIDYYGTMPFITAAVGISFNNSFGFTITPKIEQEVPAPAFNDSTQNVLTYALGVGLQEKLNDKWFASIGYEFADWGKSQLAKANGQTTNNGLIINNVYINSVLVSLTYIT